jgi:uncharacterized integral membrane protein
MVKVELIDDEKEFFDQLEKDIESNDIIVKNNEALWNTWIFRIFIIFILLIILILTLYFSLRK